MRKKKSAIKKSTSPPKGGRGVSKMSSRGTNPQGEGQQGQGQQKHGGGQQSGGSSSGGPPTTEQLLQYMMLAKGLNRETASEELAQDPDKIKAEYQKVQQLVCQSGS